MFVLRNVTIALFIADIFLIIHIETRKETGKKSILRTIFFSFVGNNLCSHRMYPVNFCISKRSPQYNRLASQICKASAQQKLNDILVHREVGEHSNEKDSIDEHHQGKLNIQPVHLDHDANDYCHGHDCYAQQLYLLQE
jgi:hypothetical protein